VPELPEVERYRALADETALNRPIAAVLAPDAWYLKRGADAPRLESALKGLEFLAARRRGKLLLLDAGEPGGPVDVVLGLRFGMSGRLVVDGAAGVEHLLYSSQSEDVRYHRFGVEFADGGALVVRDPRRLGGVELDPDEDRLGPDALDLTAAQLARALHGARVPVKARLLDQSKVAGVGNLIADEILWRAGLAPQRMAADLPAAAVRRLHRHLSAGLADLIVRGGSHTGDLQPHRRPGGRCPKDGAPLAHGTVGGRTTWWCPKHQR
jgi:formamidopyrimidine-DNA glycosylase